MPMTSPSCTCGAEPPTHQNSLLRKASTRARLWCSIAPIAAATRGRAANLGENVIALEALIILIIVGVIAGWLAGVIVKGVGFGVCIVRH
jgi:hypothetical protein